MFVLILLINGVILPLSHVECSMEKMNILEHKLDTTEHNVSNVEHNVIRELQDLRMEAATQREMINVLVKDLDDQRKITLVQHEAIQLLIEKSNEQRAELLQQKETIQTLSTMLKQHDDKLTEKDLLIADLQMMIETKSQYTCTSKNKTSKTYAQDKARLDRIKEHTVHNMKTKSISIKESPISSMDVGITKSGNVERSYKVFRKTRLELPIPTSKPAPNVAFHAVTSVQYVEHIGVHQILQFDRINLNIGGGLNSVDNYFTAPLPGVYLFSVSIESLKSHSEIYVGIVHNGQIMAKSHAGGDDRTSQGSVTITTQLKSGDKVYVINLYNMSSYNGNMFSSFTGILVSHT